MSFEQKYRIKRQTEGLQLEDYFFIYEIIKDEPSSYSQNKNGIWINMNRLSSRLLWKIHSYLESIKSRDISQIIKQIDNNSQDKTDSDSSEVFSPGQDVVSQKSTLNKKPNNGTKKTKHTRTKSSGTKKQNKSKTKSKKHKSRQFDIKAAFGICNVNHDIPLNSANVLSHLKEKKCSELSNYDKSIIKRSRYIDQQVQFKNYTGL